MYSVLHSQHLTMYCKSNKDDTRRFQHGKVRHNKIVTLENATMAFPRCVVSTPLNNTKAKSRVPFLLFLWFRTIARALIRRAKSSGYFV